MPYVEVTDNLRETIKNERKKRNIRGDKLSSILKKSTSFISQVESGKIKKIDLDILYKVFENIIQLPEEDLSKYIENILKDITIKLSPKDIEKEAWIYNFDYQYRRFPITDEAREYIKTNLAKLNITSKILVSKMNENIALDEKYKDIEVNKVNLKIDENGTTESAIRFNLKSDYIDNILNQKEETINLITMKGIIYYLFLLEGNNKYDAALLADKKRKQLKFYTLDERNEKIQETLERKNSGDESANIDNIITKIEKEFNEIYDEIENTFLFLRDSNPLYGVKVLNGFKENLEQEPSLMFAIMKQDFYKLKDLKIEDKKQFINKIDDLIKSYLPDNKGYENKKLQIIE